MLLAGLSSHWFDQQRRTRTSLEVRWFDRIRFSAHRDDVIVFDQLRSSMINRSIGLSTSDIDDDADAL